MLDKSSTGTILQCPCRQRIGASVFFFGSCWTNGRALEPMGENHSLFEMPILLSEVACKEELALLLSTVCCILLLWQVATLDEISFQLFGQTYGSNTEWVRLTWTPGIVLDECAKHENLKAFEFLNYFRRWPLS